MNLRRSRGNVRRGQLGATCLFGVVDPHPPIANPPQASDFDQSSGGRGRSGLIGREWRSVHAVQGLVDSPDAVQP